ncbi:uncharacterized protein LACBIDRAFT_297936 [Laccaria bicolor S238N-H82]|uniref:Predicted protein n=1 Tax=Laccaria bicolor (strain S238N-H82 / ATCC MYA-4686) TaxID=486041 RepID=B0DBV3_LACBS|nr:uncharacterized protein LACBIDRAFT_297936 [Laccaria bicolor S238N-H82]EDR07780.1 predicted protein [Laccaria bicolor S238N-H82]|eukprot:XP_001881569.1 predicted protein [Laccaria bicolor S238N-H82]
MLSRTDDEMDVDEEFAEGVTDEDSDGSEPSSEEDAEGEDDEENEDDAPNPEETYAEKEIEGDFDRLVQNIRLRDTSSNNGASGSGLTKDWDFSIEEKEAEFRDDLREASGIGRKRKRKGRTTGPVLSQQVRALIGDGNQAYVDSNLPEAVRIMQEVIRIEPRAAGAWSVLAQCYEDMEQGKKALQLRIMAAHLRHDADEWDRLARQSREHGYNQQALYCYRKVYSLDPTNVDALWDRASLAKEIGDFRTARNAFTAILKQFPHDLTVLRELHAILVELSELPTCADLLQTAFEHYQRIYPTPSESIFTKLDLLLLADLYNALGEHEKAAQTIRRGTRWLQGRAEQRYWDLCEDDREYDMDGWPGRSVIGEGGGIQAGRFELDANARHRLAVARIKMGEIEEGKLHANAVLAQDILDYAVLFAEIADAYFEREMCAEAKPIYELLGADPATSSIYILIQTAACMKMLEELREAAEVYEHIRQADPTHNDAKMKLAEIYEILGEPRRALELVYEVIDSRKKRAKAPATQFEDDPTTASLFAEERITRSKANAIRVQNRLTHLQLRELEAAKEKEVMQGYRKIRELWAGMMGGDEECEREWMVDAEKLVDMFRETRNLFLTSRVGWPFLFCFGFGEGLILLAGRRVTRSRGCFRGVIGRNRRSRQRLMKIGWRRGCSLTWVERDSMSRKVTKGDAQIGKVDVFRGISFDDWLKLFMQYCFILTRRGQYDVADEILRHIMVSNAYQARERQDSIRLAIITCGLAAGQHFAVVEQARKLITIHQFNNEPLRILMACLSSGLRPTDSFITSTLQKHLFREMKLADTAVKSPEVPKWNPLNKRYAPTAQSRKAEDGAEDDGDDGVPDQGGDQETGATATAGSLNLPEIPTKHNPVIVAIYGQICIAAKSYQSAIFYLLHAYDYCPDDPMICLCLAIASIGRAMQRQSDNRHHLVTQAMAFLTQYRSLRGSGMQSVPEVEYNFARTFHQLGLYSYAVKHYENVLELAEKNNDDLFAKEAAYNLSLIFVFTGATHLANALYRRWLSI